jgi:hypothetical protein
MELVLTHNPMKLNLYCLTFMNYFLVTLFLITAIIGIKNYNHELIIDWL